MRTITNTNYLWTDVISRFGLETILIYMALLMKKRVAVYHHDLMALKEVIKFANSIFPRTMHNFCLNLNCCVFCKVYD